MRRRGRGQHDNDTRSGSALPRTGPRLWLGTAVLAWLVAAACWAWWPRTLALACLAMSAIAFACYGVDKAAARTGGRRIPERRLHAIAMLGGWPGALLAQDWFRHKTAKPSFQVVSWLIVLLHAAALAWSLQQGWLQAVPTALPAHAMLPP